MTTNNERVADTSKTLTEQWKRRELETGWYYYKRENSKIEICYQFKALKYPYNIKGDDIDDVVEVLAPVPSYEELNKLQNSLEHEKVRATHYYKTLTEIEDENEKLKWLLKESRNRIDKYINIFQNEGSFYSRNLVKQIDEVLNEQP